jgi:hypothetical protein
MLADNGLSTIVTFVASAFQSHFNIACSETLVLVSTEASV